MKSHFKNIEKLTLRELLNRDPAREQKMSLQAAGITLNYKCNPITDDTLPLLAEFAQTRQLDTYIQDLTQGNIVNLTENRAAWHTALRDPNTTVNEVPAALAQIDTLCDKVHNQNITDVVHLGVGGSFWGPKLVLEALQGLPQTLNVHFVAELDETEINERLATLNPAQTLFIVVSKSFSTPETLINANRAKLWQSNLEHFIAVTAETQKAQDWGIASENILPMWDWVGGRFSVWSAVGLPIALSLGMDIFKAFLTGAHQMDQHFAHSAFTKNMPVVMALLAYSYSQFYDAPTQAVLPYSHRLRSLVPYIQQLSMESLGKQCNQQGEILDYATGPIVWGTTGSHAQHTFNQMIHQGSHCVPVDFILINDGTDNAQALRAQCLAQSHTMVFGDPEHSDAHRRITGNRPHNIIGLETLNPETLGALLALYEHKVATLGHLLNINPFDQFGVEHSKQFLKNNL